MFKLLYPTLLFLVSIFPHYLHAGGCGCVTRLYYGEDKQPAPIAESYYTSGPWHDQVVEGYNIEFDKGDSIWVSFFHGTGNCYDQYFPVKNSFLNGDSVNLIRADGESWIIEPGRYYFTFGYGTDVFSYLNVYYTGETPVGADSGDVSLTVDVSNHELEKVQVYPNPVKEGELNLNISFSDPTSYSITTYRIDGSAAYSLAENQRGEEVNLSVATSQWPKGVYIIVLKYSVNGVLTKKLLISG